MKFRNRVAAFCLLSLSQACLDYNPKAFEQQEQQQPDILVSPEFIRFGAISRDEQAESIITIANQGDDDLHVSEIELHADGPFQLIFPQPIETLQPGEEVELVVLYQPTDLYHQAAIDIHSNDRSDPLVTVPLDGEMTHSMLRIEPNPYGFDWTEVGSQREGTIALQSTGQLPLTIDQILLLGESFAISDLPLPITIQPGESLDLPVFFAPHEELNYEAELWVQSNSIANPSKGTIFGNAGSGTISGRICDPSGEGWVNHALVYIAIDANHDGIEDFRIETYTDPDGYYQLEGVIAGNHTIYVEKGSYTTEFEVEFPGGNYELTTDECLDPTSVHIAVVAGEFDSIEVILSQLDLDYNVYSAGNYMNLLRSPEELERYDIIFFNCGMPFDWLHEKDVVAMNLYDYVEQGGSVYASDWAHSLIEATWPAAIDFFGDDSKFIDPFFATEIDIDGTAFVGQATSITANIPSDIMSSAVGHEHADLMFDLEAWVVPVEVGATSNVLVEGDAPTWDFLSGDYGVTVPQAPLAIEFNAGGRVIFTTFHNEHQLTHDMEAALKEMILSL